MIFNPLFFNENGSNQLTVSQPNKLKNNKYLFSDIVKIVMNNQQNSNKLFDAEVDENKFVNNSSTPQIKFISRNPKITEQLKFDFISNSDNEKVKTELADILPDDMAKLLIDDAQSIEEKKIISYIGKEPLNEELKQFIANLIGSDLIEKHVNDESGLILNLEDSKSAVNIELTKEYGSLNNSDKIIVQTLLVPQKSKLQSLLEFGNKSENKNMVLLAGKNLAQSKKQLLENIKTNNSELKEIINENVTNKPTLSVYSFKYNSESLLNENESLKEILPSVYNIKEIKSDQNEITNKVGNHNIKTPLSKISFFPNREKLNLENKQSNSQDINKNISNNNEIKTLENYISGNKSSNNLKLFESQNSADKKEINVTKITIMKKQTNELLEYKNKFNIENNKIDTGLRRIDFRNAINNSTTSLRLLKNIKKNNHSNLNQKLTKDNEVANKEVNGNLNQNKYSNSDIDKSKINTEELRLQVNSLRTSKNITENKNIKINSEKQNLESLSIKDKASTIDENSKQKFKQAEKISELKKDERIVETESKLNEKSDIKNNNVKNEKKELKTFSEKINNEDQDLAKKEISNKSNTNNDKKVITDDKKLSIENKNISIKESNSKTINEVKSVDKTNIYKVEGEEKAVKNETKVISTVEEFQNEIKKKESKVNFEKTEAKGNINKPEIKNEKISANVFSEKTIKEESVNADKDNINKINTKETEKVDEIENDDQILNNQKENAKNKPKTKVNDESQIVNKDLTIKIKGEVKSLNNKGIKTENQNIVTETKLNNLNSEEDSLENNANSALKQNLKSNNNLELKEKSESIFHKDLKNEGIKQNNFAKIPTEELKNENSSRMVKSIEVIKELTKFITKQEEGTLTFNIKPEKLGQLKITLETINNTVRASIEVENEQAKQLIERNINELYKQLNENEVQLSSLNISLSNPKKDNATRNHKEAFSENESSEYSYETDEKTEKKSRSLGYNTYEYLA